MSRVLVAVMSQSVTMLGNCFNGSALFLLGLNMVGKIKESFTLKVSSAALIYLLATEDKMINRMIR